LDSLAVHESCGTCRCNRRGQGRRDKVSRVAQYWFSCLAQMGTSATLGSLLVAADVFQGTFIREIEPWFDRLTVDR
jgi:hypothetical protein